MDLQAYATRLREAAAAVTAAGPRIVALQAQTGRVLAQQRVQERGIAGAMYSNNQIPTYLFKGKELNAAGRAYIKKNPTGTWGGFRAAQGLPSGYVTVTYSGDMFQRLQTVAGMSTGNVFTARTVASTTSAAKKLSYNLERYGDFLAPTTQEQGELALIADKELATVLRQYL